MVISFVSPTDDLVALCTMLAPHEWGADNDMAAYTPESLRQFLHYEKNILAIGTVNDMVVCTALCYVLDHPDGSRKSLYVDELDTHPDHRRKGYASAMMSWLKEYAHSLGLQEVWLATEQEDNVVANTFYESLQPTETVACNLYSYSTKKP